MRIPLLIPVILLVAREAAADTLKVGASELYKRPCDAVAAAKPNDVVEIGPGTYTDTCSITTPGLTLRGVGGRPKIDLSGTDHPAQYKGIYVIDAANVTLENLELTGSHISTDNGSNGAGIRAEANGLTVRGCFIHDNQNGILGDGSITVEYSEFFHNGLGDGCSTGGCTHEIYIGHADSVVFRFNWSHRIASDLPDKGHLFKSRANKNYVMFNRITGEDGPDSYEVDLPNGGLAVVVGNVIQKGTKAGNSTLLAWGEEGASNPDKRLFVVNNTFVNDYGSGAFVSASGATLVAKNNVFAGKGSVPADPSNFVGDPGFVNAAAYDYHLGAASPARGKGVDPGAVDQTSLVPMFEYVHPRLSVARASAKDDGAFEYGTDAGAAGTDAGAPPVPSSDGGVVPGNDGGGGFPTPTSSSSEGCACSMARTHSDASGPCAVGLLGAVLLTRRRASRRESSEKEPT